MKTFDVNDWIRNEVGYRSNRDDFSEICKHANSLINNSGITPKEARYQLAQIFGKPDPYLTIDASDKPLAVCGTDIIPDNALGQIRKAMILPVTQAGALMPDAHLGYALPIGGVVALKNAVSPNFVGYDISCSVKLSILDIDPEELDNASFVQKALEDLESETSFGLGADYTKFKSGERKYHEVLEDDRWKSINNVKRLFDLAKNQLGSSGGGNHFADIVVGTILEDNDFFPEGYYRGDRFVALMTHSGSRGIGHKMATIYKNHAKKYTELVAKGIPNGYEWLDMDEELGREYWAVMSLMGEYAKANHELIHRDFAERMQRDILSSTYTRHNYAWIEDYDGEEVVIHRKGATPAFEGQLGIIPASMATPSRLVIGKGNKEHLNSSSHGAGRTSSRTDAFEYFDEEKHVKVIEDKGIVTSGVEADESYQAYKDIEDVMSYQEGKLIDSIATLEPKIVIMGGKSDDGD